MRRRADGGGAGGGGDVGEPAEEGVQCGLAVVDGGAFVVGERDGGEHALEVVPGFEELGLARLFRGVESHFAQAMRCGHCSKKV